MLQSRACRSCSHIIIDAATTSPGTSFRIAMLECMKFNAQRADGPMLKLNCYQLWRYWLRRSNLRWHLELGMDSADEDCLRMEFWQRSSPYIYRIGPLERGICSCTCPRWKGLRFVGVMWFFFPPHVLQIPLIRSTQQNSRCISKSTMKHLQKSDWNYDFFLFSYGYRKYMFVDFLIGYIGLPITLPSWWVVFMGPTIDSRLKTPNVGILMLQTIFEVRVGEHNSSYEKCYAQLCSLSSVEWLINIWRRSPITFKYVCLWCLVFDLHKTTYQSNVGVWLRKIATEDPSTLSATCI